MKNVKTTVKEIAERTGFTQKDVEAVIDALKEVVVSTIKEDEIKVFDGLTLGTKFVEAREGRNPSTGEAIQIPAKHRVVTKIGAGLKSAVN